MEGGPRRPPRQQQFPIIGSEVVTLSEKVFFPVNEYPGFNFMGQLLGPGGSNLKALVQETRSKYSILGKGSSKDRSKEEELIQSGDPEHAHLKENMHVIVSVKARKIEAHRRLAEALKQLNRYMVPLPDQRMEAQVESGYGNVPMDMGMVHRLPPSPGVLMRDEAPPRDGSRPDRREPRDAYVDTARQLARYPDDRDSYRNADKRANPIQNGYDYTTPKRYREEEHHDPYAR